MTADSALDVQHAAPPVRFFRTEHHGITVCRAPLTECAACREALANVHAEQLAYDLRRALAIPVWQSAYLHEATPEAIDTSLEVRRLIVRACLLHRPDFDGFAPGTTFADIFVADDLASTPISALATLGLTAAVPTRGLRRFFFWRRPR